MRPLCAALKVIRIGDTTTTPTKKSRPKLCRSVPTGSIGLFVLRGLTVITGCLGLFWCAAVLPRAEVSSYFQDFEPRLLLFENFDRAALMRILANPAGRELSP